MCSDEPSAFLHDSHHRHALTLLHHSGGFRLELLALFWRQRAEIVISQ
jgi:hypothetical protein